jgi:hypothetical protein
VRKEKVKMRGCKVQAKKFDMGLEFKQVFIRDHTNLIELKVERGQHRAVDNLRQRARQCVLTHIESDQQRHVIKGVDDYRAEEAIGVQVEHAQVGHAAKRPEWNLIIIKFGEKKENQYIFHD